MAGGWAVQRLCYFKWVSSDPLHRLTAAEYLALERQSEHRSEYLDGEVYAMTGASRRHNLIVLNLAAALHGQLKGRPCEVYANDMRVHVAATGLFTYPDVAAVCGEPRFADAALDTLLNPILLIEVLSPSTEAYDRGKKFAHYRTLGSLAELVLVAQDEIRVERYTRQEDGRWLLSEASRGDSLALPSISCEIPLSEIYERVTPPGDMSSPHVP